MTCKQAFPSMDFERVWRVCVCISRRDTSGLKAGAFHRLIILFRVLSHAGTSADWPLFWFTACSHFFFVFFCLKKELVGTVKNLQTIKKLIWKKKNDTVLFYGLKSNSVSALRLPVTSNSSDSSLNLNRIKGSYF